MSQTFRFAAASLAALLAVPAVAQQANTSRTVIDQLQFGDAFVSMSVVVPNRAQEAAAVATAAGNAASGANLAGGISAAVRQATHGATFSWSEVEGGDIRRATSIATAQGNTGQAQVVGGDLNLLGAQATTGGVFAGSRISADDTRAIAAAAAAAANNVATSAERGDLNVGLAQASYNSVYAVTDVEAWRSRETVAGASAAGNAYGSTSTVSTVDTRYDQLSTGPQIYASTNVTQARARDVTAAATSAGNSASIANQWGFAQIRGRQANSSEVSASTQVALGSWTGTAVSSAYGVGNATLATNVGSDLVADIAQENAGQVLASASFEGASHHDGDAIVASTALGNAFTGFVCSYCGEANVSGSVMQANAGNIVSTGTMRADSAGSLLGSASAIGNSATFITTTRDD
jgi:hypothetical protein